MIATAKTKNRYVDSYCNNPDQLNLSAQEMLKPAVEVISYPSMFHTLPFSSQKFQSNHQYFNQVGLQISQLRELTGRQEPTVIT